MSSEDAGKNTKREEAHRNMLNIHGYGFQHAVLRKIEELRSDYYFPWEYRSSEFPVGSERAGTRIDFILKHRKIPLYILAECKRANPRFSDWCFLQTPPRKRTSQETAVQIELVNREVGATFTLHVIHPREGIFDLPMEIKTDLKGDAQPKGSGQAIEEAATQICRGLNGMIEFSIKNRQAFSENNYVGFLPVIFTTAKLYISTADISDSDLESGNLPLSSINHEERSWLFFHYTQSPGLKHSVYSMSKATDLEDIRYQEYVRTIPIVNALGIDQFLNYGCLRSDLSWWKY